MIIRPICESKLFWGMSCSDTVDTVGVDIAWGHAHLHQLVREVRANKSSTTRNENPLALQLVPLDHLRVDLETLRRLPHLLDLALRGHWIKEVRGGVCVYVSIGSVDSADE